MTRVSVCMATYNGSRYLRKQVDSILSQLLPQDELIISDDHSTDDTLAILAGYRDPRIRLLTNPGKAGHVRNFAHAMAHATGEFISLSDQDDVWVENRLERMLAVLRQLPLYTLVVGDFVEFDSSGLLPVQVPLGASPTNGFLQLYRIFQGRHKYFGCCFLFRRELTRFILPIPAYIESHDIWIAMNASVHGRVAHVEETTLMRRLHAHNLSVKRRGLRSVVRSRINYFVGLLRSSLR